MASPYPIRFSLPGQKKERPSRAAASALPSVREQLVQDRETEPVGNDASWGHLESLLGSTLDFDDGDIMDTEPPESQIKVEPTEAGDTLASASNEPMEFRLFQKVAAVKLEADEVAPVRIEREMEVSSEKEAAKQELFEQIVIEGTQVIEQSLQPWILRKPGKVLVVPLGDEPGAVHKRKKTSQKKRRAERLIREGKLARRIKSTLPRPRGPALSWLDAMRQRAMAQKFRIVRHGIVFVHPELHAVVGMPKTSVQMERTLGPKHPSQHSKPESSGVKADRTLKRPRPAASETASSPPSSTPEHAHRAQDAELSTPERKRRTHRRKPKKLQDAETA
ncbi:uncharacterized protein BJ171DRAFT_582806 [Polychytrium aggregatum]|uniref:uncharacterized protein n=1 Tax=Polychytrium aggregatum TaxID=110093 RepID=UPI0022FE4CE1|nr:uncharacterized protein BJ171DRAFT_582806 [Polychytrium aggregatum]KAI9203661.1 hypothetical protein BJ171DRAFT_582806 [Polychytrium aggregatum]